MGDISEVGPEQVWKQLASKLKLWMLTNRYKSDIGDTGQYRVESGVDIVKLPVKEYAPDKRYAMAIVLENIEYSLLPREKSEEEVIQSLQAAFDVEVLPLRIVVCCNAAETALMSDKKATVGVMVGGSSNAAYFDPKRGAMRVDWGGFDKLTEIRQPLDLVLDSRTIDPGQHFLEKMVGAKYIAELVRIHVLELFGRNKITGSMAVGSPLLERGGLSFEVITQVLKEFEHQHHQEYLRILQVDLGLDDFFASDGKLFVHIARVICNRAADLVATMLVGLLEKAGCFSSIKDEHSELFMLGKEQQICVVVDGTVWEKIPRFKQRMKQTIAAITNRKIADAIELNANYDKRDHGAAEIAFALLSD